MPYVTSSNFVHFDGEETHPITTLDQRQTPNRRATDTNIEIIAHKTTRMATEFTEFKNEVHKSLDRLERSITYNHATQTESIERATKAAEQAKDSVKEAVTEAMSAAYPDGDPDGHRRYHEASIRKAEESAQFWAKMKLELTKYGLFGFIGWATYALWQSFLQGPHK